MTKFHIREYDIDSKTKFGLNIIETDTVEDAITKYLYQKYQQEIDNITIKEIDTTIFDNATLYSVNCEYKSLNSNYSNFFYNTYVVV